MPCVSSPETWTDVFLVMAMALAEIMTFSKVGEKEEETMVAWWHSGGCLFRIVFNGRSQLDIQRNAILKKRAGKSSKSKQKR